MKGVLHQRPEFLVADGVTPLERGIDTLVYARVNDGVAMSQVAELERLYSLPASPLYRLEDIDKMTETGLTEDELNERIKSDNPLYYQRLLGDLKRRKGKGDSKPLESVAIWVFAEEGEVRRRSYYWDVLGESNRSYRVQDDPYSDYLNRASIPRGVVLMRIQETFDFDGNPTSNAMTIDDSPTIEELTAGIHMLRIKEEARRG